MQSNEQSQGYDGILINSLRGREQDFDLDRNGFQIFKDGSDTFSLAKALDYDEYTDFNTVKSKYRAAVGEFLKERLGAEKVFPFTHEVD